MAITGTTFHRFLAYFQQTIHISAHVNMGMNTRQALLVHSTGSPKHI